jgi:hypothetical protein
VIKVSFNILSIGSAIDNQSANLSIFEIIEEVRTEMVPCHLPLMSINVGIQKLEPKPFSCSFMIHLVAPDGTSFTIGQGSCHIPPNQQRLKMVVKFNGLVFKQFGTHKIVVSFLDQNKNKFLESISELECVQLVPPAPIIPSQFN